MDKKKKLMIASGVLAALALVALYLNFGSSPPSEKFDTFSQVGTGDPSENPPPLKPEERMPWLKEREKLRPAPPK